MFFLALELFELEETIQLEITMLFACEIWNHVLNNLLLETTEECVQIDGQFSSQENLVSNEQGIFYIRQKVLFILSIQMLFMFCSLHTKYTSSLSLEYQFTIDN